MRSSSILLIAFLAACGKDKDTTEPDGNTVTDGDADTDADADGDTDPAACESTIATVDPEPGAEMIPLDQVVTVEFDVAVPSGGHYAMTMDNGATGTTALAADGLSMTFTPDAPLAPDTTYTVDVEVCDDTDSAAFTTLPPPVDTSLVEGNTYALAWDDIVITEPQNPELLQALIPIDYVLLQVIGIDTVTASADSAATVGTDDGYGNAVPDCDTIVRDDADFSLNPYYQFLDDLQITIDPNANPPTVADVEDFRLQARLSEDGTTITEISMRGLVAPEQFLDGLDCNSFVIQAMVPQCLPCSISDTGQCMLLAGTADSALQQPALDLVSACAL
jgi:hypothetical protein